MIEDHDARSFEGKVGTVGLAEELRMVSEVRAAIGDRPLQLDANGVWTLPTARYALRQLIPFDISWFEEPCETYAEMAALRQHFPVSFSTHIVDLPAAVRLGCPDAIVTNINELGGIGGAVDFIAACAAMGVGFRFHSGETGVATAAYLHLSAALAHVRGASQTLLRWYADDVIQGGPFVPMGGVVPVPQGPGLGVTLDPAATLRSVCLWTNNTIPGSASFQNDSEQYFDIRLGSPLNRQSHPADWQIGGVDPGASLAKVFSPASQAGIDHASMMIRGDGSVSLPLVRKRDQGLTTPSAMLASEIDRLHHRTIDQ
jgi:hypothetical protein